MNENKILEAHELMQNKWVKTAQWLFIAGLLLTLMTGQLIALAPWAAMVTILAVQHTKNKRREQS